MDSYIPLLSGLVGAFIGAFASVATIIVQSHYQNKRDRTKMAAQLSMEHFKLTACIAEKAVKPAVVPPPAVYLHFNMKFIELLEDDLLTPETLRLMNKENEEIEVLLESLSYQAKTRHNEQ